MNTIFEVLVESSAINTVGMENCMNPPRSGSWWEIGKFYPCRWPSSSSRPESKTRGKKKKKKKISPTIFHSARQWKVPEKTKKKKEDRSRSVSGRRQVRLTASGVRHRIPITENILNRTEFDLRPTERCDNNATWFLFFSLLGPLGRLRDDAITWLILFIIAQRVYAVETERASNRSAIAEHTYSHKFIYNIARR